MSVTAASLEARFEANMSGLNRGAAMAERRMVQSEGKIDGSTKRIGGSFAKLGKVGVVALAVLGVAAVKSGGKMVGMASDAQETQSKLEVVFGKKLPALSKHLDAFAKATGASKYALREQAGSVGALLGPMKLGERATQQMSENVVKLATDLGSFNNVNPEDALLALRSGLTGEAEPLKQFGILMNDAAVKTEGLRMGLVKGKQTMTEQQKVQARYSLMLQQTTQAQGDATRTAGSMANQQKMLKNNIADIATTIGVKLLPFALKATTTLNKMIDGTATGNAKVFADLMKGVGKAIGESLAYIGQHKTEIGAFFKFAINGALNMARLMLESFRLVHGAFTGNLAGMMRGVAGVLKYMAYLKPGLKGVAIAAEVAADGMDKSFRRSTTGIDRAIDRVDELQRDLNEIDSAQYTVDVTYRTHGRKPNASNIGGPRVASGGLIRGRGTGTSDSIPAMLSNGEYVINAKSTARHRALLEAINSGGMLGLAGGGYVAKPGRNKGETKKHYADRVHEWQLGKDDYDAFKAWGNKKSKWGTDEAKMLKTYKGMAKGADREKFKTDFYKREQGDWEKFLDKHQKPLFKGHEQTIQAAINSVIKKTGVGPKTVTSFSDMLTKYTEGFDLTESSLMQDLANAELTEGVGDDNIVRDKLEQFFIGKGSALTSWGAGQTLGAADRTAMNQAITAAIQSRGTYQNDLEANQSDDERAIAARETERANGLAANLALSQSQYATLNGPGDIGYGGGRNALQSAGGTQIVVNTLIPSDPRVYQAVADASNTGNSSGATANSMYSGGVRLAT